MSKVALDLGKLSRMGQFSLELNSLGRIRFASMRTEHFSESIRRINGPDFHVKDLVRWLFGELARRSENESYKDDDPIDGEALKPEELAAVSDESLEKFAEKILQINGFLVKTHEGKDLERASNQSACDFLVDAIRHHQAEEQRQRQRLWESVTKPVFLESTLESIRRNLDTSSRLEESIKKFSEFDFALDPARASRFEAVRPLSIPTIAKNPIHETNEILEDLARQIQDMRPLVAQGAELIRSMNDTALRMQSDYIANAERTDQQTKTATKIAAAGLVVSAIGFVVSSVFSYLSYLDAKDVDKKFEAQSALFREATERLAREQKEEISALVKTIGAGSRGLNPAEVKK